MLALSVRAPWWFSILHMGADIIERGWTTAYRGRILVHASKWWDEDRVQEDLDDAMYIMESLGWRLDMRAGIDLNSMRAAGGSIVGAVDITDSVQHDRSPWFFGKYGLRLANPAALARPVPCTGSRNLFPVPEPISRLAVAQLLVQAHRHSGDSREEAELVRPLFD